MIGWNVRHTICGLSELPLMTRGVTHVLSIVDPGFALPDRSNAPASQQRLTLRFHDIIEPRTGMVAPHHAHVEDLLTFGRTLGQQPGLHLLVHCHLGLSRSTAAMAALLAQANPEAAEDAIMEYVERMRPHAWPNMLVIALADEQLARKGRLVDALRPVYARRIASRPQLVEEMRRYGRDAEVELAYGRSARS